MWWWPYSPAIPEAAIIILCSLVGWLILGRWMHNRLVYAVFWLFIAAVNLSFWFIFWRNDFRTLPAYLVGTALVIIVAVRKPNS
jgi:FtsH-binding integral membrane protein